jgi:hypothetical protein
VRTTRGELEPKVASLGIGGEIRHLRAICTQPNTAPLLLSLLMGASSSRASSNEQIEQKKKECRLLMLGSGDCGKSTIRKQLIEVRADSSVHERLEAIEDHLPGQLHYHQRFSRVSAHDTQSCAGFRASSRFSSARAWARATTRGEASTPSRGDIGREIGGTVEF